MRRAGFACMMATWLAAYAMGQEDTLRSSTRQPVTPFLRDSLHRHLDSDGRIRMTDDLRDLFDNRLRPEVNKMTFTYPPLGRKKGFSVKPYSGFVVSTATISYGLIAQENRNLRELDMEVSNEMAERYDGHVTIDDYIRYAPYVGYYALDLFGIKAKHNFRDRTFVLVTSRLIASFTVSQMKREFGVERPDGSSKTSFPSSHTAVAFLGAQLLYREYKHVSPWIGAAGYLSAVAVGALRIRNQRHWLSDVVTGAGIGIASAEIAYLLLPVFHKVVGIKKKKKKSLVVMPAVSTGGCGAGLVYVF